MDNKSQAWPPYSQDCSQGYCSYYCPQYCFFLFPPPPPPSPSTHLLLSPLLIAVIAVVSAAFLLIAYYMLHTAYCNRQNNMISSAVLGLGPATSPENPTAWPPSHPASGVDVSLINKIAVYSYQSGTNLPVGGTDCSVCLSSYEDGDQIRFLPKCSHAFHVPCIDTWLKSHSNCPLCRAAIFPSLIPTVGGGGGGGQIDHTSVTVVVQDPTTHTSSDNNNNERDVGHDDIIEIDRRREG